MKSLLTRQDPNRNVAALDAYVAAEERYRDDVDTEVVLLGSDSLDTLKAHALEAREAARTSANAPGMATSESQQTATDRDTGTGEIAELSAIRHQAS